MNVFLIIQLVFFIYYEHIWNASFDWSSYLSLENSIVFSGYYNLRISIVAIYDWVMNRHVIGE